MFSALKYVIIIEIMAEEFFSEELMILSIIIPIYKVEKYLNECINSVISNSEFEYELILVDDGSPDNCGNICDEYASDYSYVTVIHQENGGLASARNAGLKIAKGKYVCFLDADDRIHDGSFHQVLSSLNESNADLFFMQMSKFDESSMWNIGEHIEREKLHGKGKSEAMEYLSGRPKFPGSACSKVFRREFLEENKLSFPEDRLYSEDLGFVMDCIYCAQTYDAMDMEWYEYRQNRSGSITNNVSEKSLDGIIRFIEEGKKKYSNNEKPIDEFAVFLFPFLAYEYLVLLFLENEFWSNQNIRENDKLYLEQNLWLLKYWNKKYRMIVYRVTRMIGVPRMAKVIAKARKILR